MKYCVLGVKPLNDKPVCQSAVFALFVVFILYSIVCPVAVESVEAFIVILLCDFVLSVGTLTPEPTALLIVNVCVAVPVLFPIPVRVIKAVPAFVLFMTCAVKSTLVRVLPPTVTV